MRLAWDNWLETSRAGRATCWADAGRAPAPQLASRLLTCTLTPHLPHAPRPPPEPPTPSTDDPRRRAIRRRDGCLDVGATRVLLENGRTRTEPSGATHPGHGEWLQVAHLQLGDRRAAGRGERRSRPPHPLHPSAGRPPSSSSPFLGR